MEVVNTFMTWIFKNRMGQIENFKENPIEIQKEILTELIETAKKTDFGIKNRFSSIRSYSDFARQVPLHDYEEMKEILLNFLNPEQEVTEDEDEVTTAPVVETPKTTYSEPAAPKKKSTFDEDEFDALFSEEKPKSSVVEDEDEDDDLPF
jgi:hypothetical protein